MKKNSKPTLSLIRKVVRQIIDAADPEKIILFGSCADGKAGKDSDVDLLVIMKSRKAPAERTADVSRALHFYPFPMDILVRTPEEIRYRLAIGDPFYQEILAKGKILYERRASSRVAA